ncbi:MAG: DNA-methyltransferase [Gammaproteobacteria bacterium]
MPAVPARLPRRLPLAKRLPVAPRKQADARALADTIHNMDCLKLMRAMRAESVNMVFADPPFNLKKKYSSYKDDMPFNEYMAWTEEWLSEACRILKPDGSIFVYNIPKLLTYTAAALNRFAHFRHWIAWNANGQPLGKTLMPAHYGILFYAKNAAPKFYEVRAPHKTCRACKTYLKDYGGKEYLRHKFGYQVSDVWDDIHRVRHNSKRISAHPCQLPVHLVERLILMSTDENDIVFDPFCGGGSAAVAAKQMGRRYIGAEIDPGYCKAAAQKFKGASASKINGAFASVHLNKIISIRDMDINPEKT